MRQYDTAPSLPASTGLPLLRDNYKELISFMITFIRLAHTMHTQGNRYGQNKVHEKNIYNNINQERRLTIENKILPH